MKKTDFLVVGSGLAGSVLALEMLRAGCTVRVLTDSSLPSSSRVAGGLINPVTGKYLAKTWLADTLFSTLETYYKELENRLSASFYHPTGLFRPFTGEEHRRSSQAQIIKHALEDYVEIRPADEAVSAGFNSGPEGMYSPAAGWMDMPVFLDAAARYLQGEAEWADTAFDFEEFSIQADGVKFRDWEASRVVFCEGFYARNNPYFRWLPFNPVKGETLTGVIEDYGVSTIVNQGKWIIPLGDNRVRLGATYSWHELDFEPTARAREELLAVAGKMLRKPFRVTGQQAGVRPATKDRRPFVGRHPGQPLLYIFNGLGAKGVSLAPHFAKQLVQNILHDELIHPEANIERFYTLYS